MFCSENDFHWYQALKYEGIVLAGFLSANDLEYLESNVLNLLKQRNMAKLALVLIFHSVKRML